MREYQQIDEQGRVVAHLETHGEINAPHMIETPSTGPKFGQRWNGSEFEAIVKTDKEKAAEELAEIDRKSGMNRLLRETLIAIGADKTPAMLATYETQAAAARARLK